MDEESMLQLYQNRYDETDPSSAEAREACFSPQEMRGPADINRVVVPVVDQQDARRSHATNGARCGASTSSSRGERVFSADEDEDADGEECESGNYEQSESDREVTVRQQSPRREIRHEGTEAKKFREKVLEKATHDTTSHGARPKENPDLDESKNTRRKLVDRRIIPDESSSDDEKFSPALMQIEPTRAELDNVSEVTSDELDLLPEFDTNINKFRYEFHGETIPPEARKKSISEKEAHLQNLQ